MAGHRRSSPGWYPEPDIVPGASGTLRYWDGRGWTDRRRPRPILTTLDLRGIDGTGIDGSGRPLALEGPVRALELPAPAAEIAAAREAPAGHTGGEQPGDGDARAVERPLASGRGWDGPSGPPPGNGGGGGDGGAPPGDGAEGEPGAPTRRRRKWWLLCAVAVLGALAVGLAGQAMKPSSPGPRVLTDRNFAQVANAECATTLPNLRPSDGGPLGSAVSPTQAADQIDKAANGMEALIGRLAALPASDADRPHIAGWLDGWQRFVGTGRDYAAFLRQHGTNQDKPPAVLTTAAGLARAADRFAQANGLKGCQLAYVYTATPGEF